MRTLKNAGSGRRHKTGLAVLIATLAWWSAAAHAAQPTLTLELNRAEPTQAGCLLSFLARNGTGQDLAEPSFELVFFNGDGIIDRLTVFDFGKMEAGRTVVRQFDVPALACDEGRILLNGPAGCTDISAAHCAVAVKVSSKTDLSFQH